MKEEWRQCFNYEGIYVVSSRGRIARVLPDGQRRMMNPKFRDRYGYLMISLKDGGRKTLSRVCKVVAMAFLGAGEKWFVRHKDGDIRNNSVANLEVSQFKVDFVVELTHELLLNTVEYNPITGEFTKDGESTGSEKCFNGKMYVQLWLHRKQYLAHRIAVFYMTREWPESEVDHKDGNGLNNRWKNLRCCTRLENCRNARFRSRPKHKLKGVYFRVSRKNGKKMWYASIGAGGKTETRGSYKTMREAIQERRRLEEKHGYHEGHGSTRK